MLSYDAVSYSYASSEGPVRALSGVSLRVDRGQMVAVLGANGSGKSTLARLANGLELPSAGCVEVDGVRTDDPTRIYEVRSTVGLVFQNPDDQIVATSVEDDVAFGPENLGLDRTEIRRRVTDSISAVGLTGLETREPHRLSGGQKQRLAIAGALAMLPAYLVLDEPTSMLDPVGREEVLAVIRQLRDSGHGILLVTHDLVEASLAETVVVLREGQVAFSGPPADLLGRAGLEEFALEIPAVIRLAQELRACGVDVPTTAVMPEEIGAALWPS